MLVNKSFETPQGTVKFEGELEEKELDLVLKVGLNFLFQIFAFFRSWEESLNNPMPLLHSLHNNPRILPDMWQ